MSRGDSIYMQNDCDFGSEMFKLLTKWGATPEVLGSKTDSVRSESLFN